MKNNLSPRAVSSSRAAIEARRGIVRDATGHILRSPEWRQERIAQLKSKVEDYKIRIKNATAEIKQRQAELEG
jgi:hypothetical protein